MLRKLGMVLAAGALVAGCGVGTVPAKNSGGFSPVVTTSSSPAYATPAPSEVSVPITSASSVAPVVAPAGTTEVAIPEAPAIKKAPVTHAPVTHAPAAQAPATHAPAPATHAPAAECGGDYYVNSSGNCVHRPSSNPAGATALCKDGSYSYSQHRSGTCSGHGGVKNWL
ncbi:DUF3761 domain-containing protein [Amycolatopsis sp. PS_44_ISF1]|uniref:DUF3761 domain-containing protein n=1 Tax=Amycolatopsis sp. PS_44_ISF1 TaxID=2974917 RepID=UPI0028DD86C0|nr:DUF3761 domain-containing protein [Amycolatopsis sp. PS_44_ISF1]MDT8911618.1 DUF3761 domain-containing protein [Amycolatopsis sp. PS_44_ISF1]